MSELAWLTARRVVGRLLFVKQFVYVAHCGRALGTDGTIMDATTKYHLDEHMGRCAREVGSA